MLHSDVVVSHRDLVVKNVLWRPGKKPAVIDWESGGLVNPMWELVDAALNWCGQTSGHPDRARFQALISAYREVTPLDQTMFEPAFVGCLGARMEWLEFNMQRSLDPATPADEKTLAAKEVRGTLADIVTLSSQRAEFHVWFNDAICSEID